MRSYDVDVYLRDGHHLRLTLDQRLRVHHHDILVTWIQGRRFVRGEDEAPADVYTAGTYDHYEIAVEAAKIEATYEYCAKVIVFKVDTASIGHTSREYHTRTDVLDLPGVHATA